LFDGVFKQLNLLIERIDQHEIAFDRQLDGAIINQIEHGVIGFFNDFIGNVEARRAPDLILCAQHVGEAMPNELQAFTEQVTHGTFLFRVDIPCGQDAQAH